MKAFKRALTLFLVLSMLAGLAVIPAGADMTYINYADFEGSGTAGDLVACDSGLTGLEIGTEEDGNRYLKVPLSAKGKKVWNKDKKGTALQYGAYVVEVDYQLVGRDANAAFYLTMIDDSFGGASNGGWPNLVRIKGDGSLFFDTVDNAGTRTATVALEKWFRLKIVVDPAENTKTLYLNGELVQSGVRFTTKAGHQVSRLGIVNIATTGSTVVYVDNFRMYYQPTATVTVNGEQMTVGSGSTIGLSVAGKRLLFAKITAADGTVTYTQEETVSAVDGMKVETVSVDFETLTGAGVRINEPTGLRWISRLNRADYDALRASSLITDVKIGTLIAPLVYVRAAADFTREALTGKFPTGGFVDVAATTGCWYTGEQAEGSVFFAGSLANIAESNYNRLFAGVGYLSVTLTDGEVLTLYGSYREDDHARSVAAVAKAALEDPESGLDDAQKAAIRKYAEAYAATNAALYGENLRGLNVLAIGDSLFRGHELVQDDQWINRMGKACGWNLTNLGGNGWTVSYPAGGVCPDGRTRQSMYNNLMTNAGYRFSGSAEDVDLILFEGAYNDYGGLVALGDVDSTDPTTFLGAWNLMTAKLLELYPNATVVFVTPWQLSGYNTNRTETPKLTYLEYTTSINRLYEAKYRDHDRVLLLDAGDPAVSGVNMDSADFRSLYGWAMNDRFHLNAAGMALMEDAMYEPLCRLLKKI